MSDLRHELSRRYPILDTVRLSRAGSGEAEAVPPFVGLLCALAESGHNRGCCVVVPEPSGLAHALASVLAMVRLRREFDLLTKAWAERGFESGQTVRVLPSGHVFVYEGVYDHKPSLFQLREPGSTSTCSLPVSEVLRLEPTTRKRPKGKVTGEVLSLLRKRELPPIDRLLGIVSWGNESLFRNRVLLLSSHSGFSAFLNETAACQTNGNESGILREILPWGAIDDDGRFQPGDNYLVRGEPIVAVTHDVGVLADACVGDDSAEEDGLLSGFATGRAVVVADGAGRLLRDIRALDDVASARKVVVIAGPDDHDEVRLLADRGLDVWRATPDEMTVTPTGMSGDGTLFGGFARAARNQRLFRMAAVRCEDEGLDLAAAALILAVDAVRELEGEEEILSGVRSLFGVLFRASERLIPYASAEAVEISSRLEAVGSQVSHRARWMSADTVEMVHEAVTALRGAVTAPSLGETKAAALANLLSRRNDELERSELILVRYAASRPAVEAWLRERELKATVHAGRRIPEGCRPDHVVSLGWPGAPGFRTLVGRYRSPCVTLVGYPFEADWMAQFKERWESDARRAALPREARGAMLGLPSELLPLSEGDSSSVPGGTEASDLDVFDIERRVLRRRKGEALRAESGDTASARYVGFVGDTFAWITEGATLPVVTDVVRGAVDGTGAARRNLPRRVLDDLEPGDFVLFREGSDHDVVRAFAELIAGPEAYRDLRRQATSWREQLRVFAPSSAHLYRALRAGGLTRSPLTVRKWLLDNDQIGPQDRSDLDVIAAVAGPLPESVDAVWEAICEVRAYHAQAGHRISDWLLAEIPRHADRLRGGEAQLKLAFGTAYVVEIEDIDREPMEVPALHVNELRWDTAH